MKYIITLFCLIGSLSFAFGQQPGQYSLYMLNNFQVNPAYAGLDHSLSITGIFRKQWVDLPGSPSQQHINVHAPLYFLSGGIGLNFENETIGAETNLRATLAYNYQMPIGKVGILSFGMSGGLVQKKLDGTILRTPDGEYIDGNSIDHQDNTLSTSVQTGQAPVFEAGIYYQSEKLEIGLSAKNLLESQISLDLLDVDFRRNYFATAAYLLDIGTNLTFKPSIMVKSDLVETQIDFSLLVQYNDNIFLGASFRGYQKSNTDAIVLLTGFKLNEKISLAYAYDLTLSSLSNASSGSHEIMLNYNLNKPIGKGKLPGIIYNPRFY